MNPHAHNAPSTRSTHALPAGVRIAGTGACLPEKRLTNKDLESLMQTSDEWIVQRTGIRERRLIGPGESTHVIASRALADALRDARLTPSDLDLIIIATMTPEMSCPATACLVANDMGQGIPGGLRCGSMDLVAACSGFVYGLNIAHDLIRGGAYRTIGLVGADTLSTLMDYTDNGRGTAIIFGDGAGAAVLRASDTPGQGLLAQAMHADGSGWKDIYVPVRDRDFPPGVAPDACKINKVQMNGSAVFKFAVGTFSDLIAETLDKARLKPEDIAQFVCHQSNARILAAARERFGIPEDKLYVNIDRVGNTVAASVPLCLHELRAAQRLREGDKVMFLAFGGGLTWGSSLWQL